MAASGQLRPFRFIIALPVEMLTGKRGFFQLEVRPALPAVALCVVLSLAGLAALYALFVLAISASFLLVRIQNLTNVLLSMLDFSRWPIEMFTPCWRLVFTVVVPLGVVTSYPVMALLRAK